MHALARGAPFDLMFQSMAGTEAANFYDSEVDLRPAVVQNPPSRDIEYGDRWNQLPCTTTFPTISPWDFKGAALGYK
jgi:hypothetical protein